jgi:hypothetical protein
VRSCAPETCCCHPDTPSTRHIPLCRCAGKDVWDLFEEFQGLLDLVDGPDPAIAAAALVALYQRFCDIAAVRQSSVIYCCICVLVASHAAMKVSRCLAAVICFTMIVTAHVCACHLVRC